jgi:ESCRT-I complex subunit VPS28
MATISLDEEVRLYTTNAQREKYNTLATLYGIIVALDYLERAYVRDAITAAESVLFHIRDETNSEQLLSFTRDIRPLVHAFYPSTRPC